MTRNLISPTAVVDNVDDVMASHITTLQNWVKKTWNTFAFVGATEKTISSGVITATGNYHTVDTESDAASDNLDTILLGTDIEEASILIIRPEHDDRTVVVKHGTGNILCVGGTDLILNDEEDFVIMIYDAGLASWLALQGGVGEVVLSDIKVFSSSGTWTKYATLQYVVVNVIGGGGGGGGAAAAANEVAAGGGGGAGGYAEEFILAASLGATETITVGAGGNGGAAGNNNGAAGGDSSFGAHCSASGGTGGIGNANSATVPRFGGSGNDSGIGSGGDLNRRLGYGDIGICLSISSAVGGSGGGDGGARGRAQNLAANAGLNGQGGGGAGAATSNTTTALAGGNGGSGIVVVYEYTKE